MEQAESALRGFETNPYFWDWIMLACIMMTVLGVLLFVVWLLGLPGRIAIARNHPDAEAVYTMGWVGFLAIVPWIQALIWAFKPTDKIDIRYFPEQERLNELEELQRLSRYAYGRDLSPENLERLKRAAADGPPPETEDSGRQPSPEGSRSTDVPPPEPGSRES